MNSLLALEKPAGPAAPLSENDYYRSWQTIDKDAPPEAIAYSGGYLADRLAFLFIAGYQAAVRRTFDIPGNGWAALAVSEDRRGELPGLVLADGMLEGNKTWVASAALVSHVIVSARSGDDEILYRVDRDQAGLDLVMKEPQSFLADMSQGIARFTAVPAGELATVPPVPLKVFARREPLYLYLAFTGFLAAQGRADPSLVADLLTVANDSEDTMAARELIADVDQRIRTLFAELPPDLFNGDYKADKGLIGLYSPSIQRRKEPRPA